MAHLECQLSIYNSFPVIRTTIAKNRHLYVPRPSFFVCPGDAPVAITQNVVWMKRQFSACQTPRSMYTSILNSFPVIRTASAKKSPFSRTAAHIFVSCGDAPAISRSVLHWWKDNSMLVKRLTACTHLSSTVSQLFELQVQKIAIFTYRSPHFCFPWGRSWGNHAKCCMDGKRIRWLQIVSLHVLI